MPLLMPHVPDDRAATLDAFRAAPRRTQISSSPPAASPSAATTSSRRSSRSSVASTCGASRCSRASRSCSGRLGETPFLGLPGNPVSIHVSFEQFVRPAIRKMRGCSALFRPTITATLTSTIEKRPGPTPLREGPSRVGSERLARHAHGASGLAHPVQPRRHTRGRGVRKGPRPVGRGREVAVQVWSLPGGSPG